MKPSISTVSMVALVAFSTVPARAQVVTISPAELMRMAEQLAQMKQEYQGVLGIFGSLTRSINPNSMATNLIGSNPLPGVPQVSQMMVGGGNFGSLGGAARQFLSANTVYTPQSTGPDDFNAAYMQRIGNTLSGVQAMAQQSMSSIASHITGLTEVQGQLSSVTTEADMSAIKGRLQAEQANLAAQGTQAQSLQTMLVAQHQQYELQQMQIQRQSADALLASATGGGGVGPQTTALNVPTFTGP